MALLQILRPTLPILIGASHHAHDEHGVAAELRYLHAATDARHRNFGVAVHVGAGRAKPRLGIRAAGRRRHDGALRVSSDHDRGLADVHRGARLDGDRAGDDPDPDRRWRADRYLAGLHGQGDCDVGVGARGAGHRAQHRDGHGLGGGIARRITVGADRADVERRFWLAGRRRRLCDSVAVHAAGCLVRGPGRQDSAAAQGRRRHR